MSFPNPIRIALIDDHVLVRDGVKSLLSAMPHFEVVAQAESGAEALELVANTELDLLLVDVGLKDMNGLELTRRLCSLYPGIKILILSMYDNQEYVRTSINAGAFGYVLKNAPSTELIAAIEAIVAGGSFYSPEIARKLATNVRDENELTPRELQVLSMLAKGLNNKEVARELDISVRTVETYRLSIRRKLNIDTPAALVKYALEHGLISI
ncbi:response regulator transcription factor [Pseudomonas sp. JS3066]|jgi:DNA-binding NarL/FixJ family response regulator|uniref:response regulator n=1 Tax=unclassified Pseudomonas TaxID=196821 RepID=UPI000EA919EC|nr:MULTISPECIES: response regulator transcription factor [unclassified Pseudomonas]AYF86438.1 DNA-binding response regulator [Pseudomonas sp. DY-1]MDH4654849.1 response regulator transcription factor [Pseudomonas sp. BN606]MRK23767.1 response regulator transcription factor [Pseudomonas sp. JG-B]WVK96112.1 response regulator transcription factor [Pseudomonas sp. JS3066]